MLLKLVIKTLKLQDRNRIPKFFFRILILLIFANYGHSQEKSISVVSNENTAIVPVPKLENDSYDWWVRHAEVLRIKDSINPEIVLIGNSITGDYAILMVLNLGILFLVIIVF